MANQKRLEVLLTGDARQAAKAFGDLERGADKAGRNTKAALSKAHQALVGFGAGAFVAKAFSGFEEAQKVNAQTEAAIRSTGGAAHVTAKQVDDLSGSMQKQAAISDETIQSGENLLLTFTNIRNEAGAGNDVFNQSVQVMTDMSVAMGTDMKSSAIQLGKALNDPVKGITALTRVGVTFTDGQKAQIRTLVESGNTLEAQKIILAELTKEFGGSAAAQATASAKARVAFDDMAESVGEVVAPAMQSGAEGLAALAEGFATLPRPARQAVVGLAGVGVAAVVMGPKIKAGWDLLSGLAADATRLGKNLIVPSKALDGLGTEAFAASKGQRSLAGALDSVNPAAIGASAAVAGLVAIYIDATQESRKTQKAARDLADTMTQSGESLDSVFNEKLANTLARVSGGFDLAGKGKLLASDLSAVGVSADELSAALLGTDEAYNTFEASLRDALASGDYEKTAAASRLLWNDLPVLRSAALDAAGSVKDLGSAQKSLGVETDDAAEATDTAAKAAESYARQVQAVEERVADATKAIEDFYDAQTKGLASRVEVEQSLADLTGSFAENGAALDITTQKGRDNVSALIDYKQSVVDAAMATRDLTGSTGEATAQIDAYRLRLVDAMLQAGFTNDQVALMVQQMGLTPAQVSTTFRSNATDQEQKANRLTQAMDRIPNHKDLWIQAHTDSAEAQIRRLSQQLSALDTSVLAGSAGRAIQESIGHRAGGGPVSAGVPYFVGERGTELFVPDTSGTIVPAERTRNMISSGVPAVGGPAGGPSVVVNVVVQGSVTTERDLVEQIRLGIAKSERIRYGLGTIEPGGLSPVLVAP